MKMFVIGCQKCPLSHESQEGYSYCAHPSLDHEPTLMIDKYLDDEHKGAPAECPLRNGELTIDLIALAPMRTS